MGALTSNPIRRVCARSLPILSAGAVAYVAFHEVMPEWLGGAAAIATVVAAYVPMTRIRCPHCQRFPFTGWLNVGPLPMLCLATSEKCRNCERGILQAVTLPDGR